MASIYTCPDCRRRYTIYDDGDYLCECGRIFAYPPVLSRERACFISMEQAAGRKGSSRRSNCQPEVYNGASVGINAKPGFLVMMARALNFTLF